jgi:hypothetical protein
MFPGLTESFGTNPKISMMMSSRRKARERRMAEHRHLKEKLDTIRQEHQFEAALGQDQRDLFHQEHNAEGPPCL